MTGCLLADNEYVTKIIQVDMHSCILMHNYVYRYMHSLIVPSINDKLTRLTRGVLVYWQILRQVAHITCFAVSLALSPLVVILH